MESRVKSHPVCRRWSAFLLLALSIFLIYSNTFDASWHLDDYHNITNNPHLKVTNLRPESIIRTFYASHDRGLYLGKTLYRPLPCLSFGLNWYFGKDNLFGYHLVNIIIHFVTAAVLFLTILRLFETPNLKTEDRNHRYFIALLASVLWAINPIQTQAVTYIVQRMASMAGMFYICGIYFYISGRVSDLKSRQALNYLGCGLSFVCAIASKQNAATMPLTLILVEAIFFKDLSQPRIRKLFWGTMATGALAIVLLGYLFCLNGDALWFQKSYQNRFFTPIERLLTQPRVVVLYLTQIFYPAPTRLSIEHDVTVSTSVFHPWSTLPSILIVLLFIGVGLWQMRKRPAFSFAILFFFLNHVIESSIIGLELVFEHRNYLPTLFLFLPVAVGLKWLLDYYKQRQAFTHVIIASFIILLMIGWGSATYIRNQAWDTEKSLWEDAIQKAPGSNRAVHNLAWGYFESTGQTDRAMELYKKSLELKKHSKNHKALSLNNMANIYYQKGEYQKAVQIWKQAADSYPDFEFIEYRLALGLTKSGNLADASTLVDTLIAKQPGYDEYQFLKGSILLRQQKPERALTYFRELLKQKPHSKKVLTKLGITFNLLGDYRRAEMFLRSALARDPQDISTLLWLIVTNKKLQDPQDVDHYMNQLFALVSVEGLTSNLEIISENDLIISTQQELLKAEIVRRLNQKSKEIATLQNHFKRMPDSLWGVR